MKDTGRRLAQSLVLTDCDTVRRRDNFYGSYSRIEFRSGGKFHGDDKSYRYEGKAAVGKLFSGFIGIKWLGPQRDPSMGALQCRFRFIFRFSPLNWQGCVRTSALRWRTRRTRRTITLAGVGSQNAWAMAIAGWLVQFLPIFKNTGATTPMSPR